MISRRSKASSVSGRRSSGPRFGRADDRLGEGRPRRASRPRRGPQTSLGTDRQATTGRPAPAKTDSTSAAGLAARRLGREAGRARRSPGRPAAASGPAMQLEQRPIERQGHARAVARLAVGTERAPMAEGAPGRPAPAAGPGRASARRRRRRTRRRRRRARSARRTAGWPDDGGGGAGSAPWLVSEERDGSAAVERSRQRPIAVGGDVRTRGRAPSRDARHDLIGDLAVDGEVEAGDSSDSVLTRMPRMRSTTLTMTKVATTA